MPIGTLNQLVAGMAGKSPHYFHKTFVAGTPVITRPFSFWASPGIPGPGSYDSTLNGVVLSSTSALVTGQLPFYDPAGGQYTYLSRFAVGSGLNGQVLLCDRLWHNGGYTITSTSAQNSTTPTWPARDADGTTNGKGVLLGLEVSANIGAAAPTITVTYTNSAGTGSRTGVFVNPTANSPTVGSFFPITLQAGDVGVQSLQSIQLSASWLSGTMNMVAYRVLATVTIPGLGMPASIDALSSGLPRLYDGTVPFLLVYPGTGTLATQTLGSYSVAQG